MPLTSRSYPKATPHTEQEFNDGLAVLGSKLSRVASAGGAALAAGLAGRSALRAAQSAAYPTRYAPWWDKAAAVAGPLYGPTSTRGQLSRTPSTRGKATGGALVRSPTIGPGLSYSRGGSRNIHRSALAASHAPDSDSDDAMSSDGEDPEEASSDEEEFEVAIDDDCSCAACRWNLERSKEWDSQN